MCTEILDNDKNRLFKTGDLLDVVVTRIRDGEVRVSRPGTKKSSVDLESLEDAYDMELPVAGKVTEICNGGFRVHVMNTVAFCPISQMDSKPITQPENFVGKKLEFIVTKYEGGGRNIVVSRRKILDQEKP